MTTTNRLSDHLTGPYAYYARKSDSKSDLGRQVQNIDAACRESGVVIPRHLRYQDTGSRDKSDKRKQFQQMLRDAEAGRFRTLLISNLDRFGIEDEYECIELVRRLQKAKVTLYSLEPGEGVLTSKDKQTLFNLIFKASASKEEQIKKGGRAITGKVNRLNQGASFQGGPCPYGFDKRCTSPAGEHLWTIHYQGEGLRLMIGQDDVERRCDGDKTTHPIKRRDDIITLVPSQDDGRVRAVKLIFDLWANQDLPILGICKKLNQLGLRHYADMWKPTAVRSILENPVYIGNMVFNRMKVGRFVSSTKDGREIKHEQDEDRHKRYQRDPKEWIVIKGAHTAIVDRTTFDKAQMKLASLKTRYVRPARHPDLWLRRFCVCANCGTPMQARHVGRTPYLLCLKRKSEMSIGAKPSCQFFSVPHAKVEEIVQQELGELATRITNVGEEELLAMMKQLQPKMLALATWNVEVAEHVAEKVWGKFGIVIEPNDNKAKLKRMKDKAVWDEGDLPDPKKVWAVIKREAEQRPEIGAYVDEVAKEWDDGILHQLGDLKAKHVTATTRWATASDEQAPTLKGVCDALEVEMTELKKKLIVQNMADFKAVLDEAKEFGRQVEEAMRSIEGDNGHAKAEALKELVKEIRLEFQPKTTAKAKSKLVACKLVLCDGDDVRATAWTSPRSGRPVRAGS
jgi:DNA invertase Pin-like site-specific DNA recombinase